MNINKIKELCIEGLLTDGGHHKQWFLEQVLINLNIDLNEINDQLIKEQAEVNEEDPEDYKLCYQDGEYIWDKGIPP